MLVNEILQCPSCGHNFYHDSPNENGICQWCQNEKDNPVHCHICNSIGTNRGEMGYLCDAKKCRKIDKLLAEIEFIKKYE
jgi:hypothetical protein